MPRPGNNAPQQTGAPRRRGPPDHGNQTDFSLNEDLAQDKGKKPDFWGYGVCPSCHAKLRASLWWATNSQTNQDFLGGKMSVAQARNDEGNRAPIQPSGGQSPQGRPYQEPFAQAPIYSPPGPGEYHMGESTQAHQAQYPPEQGQEATIGQRGTDERYPPARGAPGTNVQRYQGD